MEVVFTLFKCFKIILGSTRVVLQMLQSKFTWFPAISLLFRGGRVGGWVGVLIENKTKSAQLELELGPSLAIMNIRSLENKSQIVNIHCLQ